MNTEQPEIPPVGTKVVFESSHPSPARRSLNGGVYKVKETDETSGKGWVKHSGTVGYQYGIAVFLENTQTFQKIWASLDEFKVIS